MRLIHFVLPNEETIRFGAICGETVVDGSDLVSFDPTQADGGVNDRFQLDGEALRILAQRQEGVPLAEVRLLSPVPFPGKVICIGLNYHDHAIESGMEPPPLPLVFSKFPACVIGPDEPILLPPGSEEVDFEAELAVVIGRDARRVSKADAIDHVLGYCCANDVSARDFQFADGQWQRGKSCENSCPLGPFIATRDEISDPEALAIGLRLNGNSMQASSTEQLIFSIAEVVSFLSGFIPLAPGDVILTGTPPGVGFARTPPVYLAHGDICEVEIEGLGVLRNPVRR